jgi:two-component system, NtrC family, nitrogen regulation sensor histidine kinase NtrY
MASDKLLRSSTRNLLLVLLLLAGALAGFLISRQDWLAVTILIIGCLVIILILRRIYNNTNNAVAAFFDSLENDDTTLHFPEVKENSSLKRLYESMERLNKHFQDIRLKNEYNESFYRTLIEFASTGLIVLDGNDSIVLINKVACSFAGISPESTNRGFLKIRHPEFYEAICSLRPGETITYRHLVSNELRMLSFKAVRIKRDEKDLKLVSVHDIRSELEYRELESYRKLMNVMTHEIMNLLSPITSVSKELCSQFNLISTKEHSLVSTDPDITKALTGLNMINEQSNSLINFVNSYRRISKIPQPEFGSIDAEEWAGQLMIAFSGRMKEDEISFSVNRERNVSNIIADRNLLNQVMINLINNAHDAVMELESNRMITIRILKKPDERILISVSNNGPRIPSDLIEKIFVPFFTTRKNGSGIGLSISQEIMKLHRGSIIATSPESGPTSFLVEL